MDRRSCLSVRTGGLSWDKATSNQDGVLKFQDRMCDLFTCNCHSFVATCLNRMAYFSRLCAVEYCGFGVSCRFQDSVG
ncbi:hypothetical protein CBR_g8463 [Chara braunii]|uniref:Uncharacterized protein n=1 Tax=Chara braunii TaxID=69332 RepID=A0A388KM85_CHABU|nr:hypothetical protein CBR_g8463 [Chara braunii]|eukprot:GBG71161.1 hypothetical protein CBR_g8463 [Chara braunii]